MSLIRQCLSTQGPKKTILVLDGGGARGGFALEVLCHIARSQPVPLSQLFSMIVGVSAGSFVGSIVALGLLDDVTTLENTCASFYSQLPQMFSNPADFLFSPKFNGVGKKNTLQKVLGNKTLQDVKTPLVVLCSTMDGAPVMFRSWEDKSKMNLLADILDASSAVPVFFPPVFLNDMWLIDGGVCANKPLIQALLTAIKFFDQNNMYFLNIGTVYTSTRKFSFKKAMKMGLIGWMLNGLFDVLLGVQDHTSEELMTELFAERFLRLDCACADIRLDDISKEHKSRLMKMAEMVWSRHKQQVLMFVKP